MPDPIDAQRFDNRSEFAALLRAQKFGYSLAPTPFLLTHAHTPSPTCIRASRPVSDSDWGAMCGSHSGSRPLRLGPDCGGLVGWLCSHIAHTISICGGIGVEKTGSLQPRINQLRPFRTGSDGPKRFRFPLALPIPHRLTGHALPPAADQGESLSLAGFSGKFWRWKSSQRLAASSSRPRIA
jgi:hypothetical protein